MKKLLDRSQELFKEFRKFIIGSITIIGTLIAFLELQLPLWGYIAVPLLLVLIGVWIALRRSTTVDVPLLPPPAPPQSYACCHVNRDQITAANQIAKQAFRHGSLDIERIMAWHGKNPFIHVILKNPHGEVCGYFEVLPLKKDFMASFINGKVEENQITSEEILSTSHARKTARLYISGVAVKDRNSSEGKNNGAALLWAGINFLERYYGDSKVKQIYALAWTKEGKKLLEKFDFEIASHAASRSDGVHFYVSEFSIKKLRDMKEAFPNSRELCNIDEILAL
jgi:uncharacterized membrane protein